ncbi:aldo/keto reductase [Lampropedia aestuarii]|uniref:Aldo/keto reductase n=1 Tax=Lampropedia aestuarii TaxID=2562762 RepID=A0A4S5BM72_9BURK|nr:aldo/keto reductase [Lampropedia aestuarii]MDH5856191.1 aldo/keto reductase [Lampropedia aestuarii]THJ33470.1 aldo/keto reductase [Lampropedia aestuarii]
MEKRTLGQSDLQVSPICLGTMTFGEQVGEAQSHAILDQALAAGVDFWDTAEMYSVPPRRETYGATETILGNWFAKNPGKRNQVVLASKVAGPSRGMPWVREGKGMTAADIVASCDASLKRLQTDVIDLYQIHWPERNVPAFGAMYFNPELERTQTSILEQLQALDGLVRAGKIRYIGLSNETPYGVHEFVRLAEQHGLARVVSIQNPYALTNRWYENALDETCYRLNVGLLAYSPLAFGALTGKYDQTGIFSAEAPRGRLSIYEATQKQRWARASAIATAKRYNDLAREHGLTPTQLALSFVYHKWQVASTIIGVTTQAQLAEDIEAWNVRLSAPVLEAIDAIRLELRDPAV